MDRHIIIVITKNGQSHTTEFSGYGGESCALYWFNSHKHERTLYAFWFTNGDLRTQIQYPKIETPQAPDRS